MSKANHLASLPHIPISGKNMVINGSFQRFFRVRRTSDMWSQSGPQWITDRWCASAAGAASNLTYTVKGDTIMDASNKDLKVSTVGSQYAYLGVQGISNTDDKNIICLQQGIEQNLACALKWGTPEAKPAVLSFRGMFSPGAQDTNSSITISVAIRTKGTNSTTSPDEKQRTFVTTAVLTKTANRFVISIPPLTDPVINEIAQQSGDGALSVIFVYSAGPTAAGRATSSTSDQWSKYGNFIHQNQENKVVNSAVGSQIFLSDVQLEEGKVATPYEVIDFSLLRLQCARYYYRVGVNFFTLNAIPVDVGTTSTTWSVNMDIPLPTPMRTVTPIVTHNLTESGYSPTTPAQYRWSLMAHQMGYVAKASGTMTFTGFLYEGRIGLTITGATFNYTPNVIVLGTDTFLAADAEIL